MLVHGGAGDVGYVSVELALAPGAKVFATVSERERERGVVEALGVTPIDYRAQPVERYVRSATDGVGFDLVVVKMPSTIRFWPVICIVCVIALTSIFANSLLCPDKRLYETFIRVTVYFSPRILRILRVIGQFAAVLFI